MRSPLLIAVPLTACALVLSGCGGGDVQTPEYRGDSRSAAVASGEEIPAAEESAAPESSPPAESPSPAESSPEAEPAPEPTTTAAPAETTEPQTAAPGADSRTAYLQDLKNMGFTFDDNRAMTLGNKVCADLRGGKSFTAAADGADPNDRARGAQIAGSAVTFLCPDQVSKITGT